MKARVPFRARRVPVQDDLRLIADAFRQEFEENQAIDAGHGVLPAHLSARIEATRIPAREVAKDPCRSFAEVPDGVLQLGIDVRTSRTGSVTFRTESVKISCGLAAHGLIGSIAEHCHRAGAKAVRFYRLPAARTDCLLADDPIPLRVRRIGFEPDTYIMEVMIEPLAGGGQ